ncbi:MAG TPA: hypothetical protein VFC19_27850 [Candidatus Limnocylindrales bacterium]|nr:hypothetical protein [Candidatus Limnocylindrales bacterium]
MTPLDEDLPPASPAETLRVIEQQRAAAERKLQPHPLVFFGPWGAAWLVGFGLLFLRFGPGGRVFVPMPKWIPLTSLFVLLAAALVVSTYFSSRTFRHVRGRSSVKGAMYGFAWSIAFVGMGVTLSRFNGVLSDPDIGMLWTTVAVGLTGALHMAGGAVWEERSLFAVGVWLTVVNIVGTLLGPGWHALVISLAGGGGMLLAGFAMLLRARAPKGGKT